MNKQKTKINRTVSIDRNLDNIMNDKIKNKSKYIEWLIYQDLKNIDGERIKKIISIENESKKNNETQIFIETPYRNQHVFNDLIENLKEQTKLCIGSDITSENEFILTKNIKGWKKEIATELKNKPCVFLLQS